MFNSIDYKIQLGKNGSYFYQLLVFFVLKSWFLINVYYCCYNNNNNHCGFHFRHVFSLVNLDFHHSTPPGNFLLPPIPWKYLPFRTLSQSKRYLPFLLSFSLLTEIFHFLLLVTSIIPSHLINLN